MRIYRKLGMLLALALLAGGSVASAQDQEQPKRTATKPKKYVYKGDEIVLVGKIAKPQVQFIISREKGTSEEALELKESFVPKILDALNEPPFE